MDDYLLFRRRDSRLALIALAHRAGDYATVAMSAGAIITGLTVLPPSRRCASISSSGLVRCTTALFKIVEKRDKSIDVAKLHLS